MAGWLLLLTLLLVTGHRAVADQDSDGDGLMDSLDTDDNNDGIIDILDNDDDGDGILDFNEDDDGDGVINACKYNRKTLKSLFLKSYKFYS